MAKIRIQHFGPIKTGFQDNDGFLDLRKVTVFIGNQGSGKSTVAKLISTFSWMEKALTRGDYKPKDFTDYHRFRKTYCAYHRLENYFFNQSGEDKARLEYRGSSYHFLYENGSLSIQSAEKTHYALPQIMYVPAERNFIANVKSPKAIKLTSDSLVEFVTEFDLAKNQLKGDLELPLNEVVLEYQKLNDLLYVKGADYKIQLKEASSGFQSVVPLFLVSWYLAHSVKSQSESSQPMSSEELDRFRRGVADIWSNEALTDDQRRAALSVLSARFNKAAFQNIVEEPEQNLFPSSQWAILKSLLEFNNMVPENQLLITTHSPYLVNFLSIAIQAAYLHRQMETRGEEASDLRNRLEAIVPQQAQVAAEEVVIYQFDELNGSISQLSQPNGVPSGNNYLNEMLRLGNQMFDSLLAIEQEL